MQHVSRKDIQKLSEDPISFAMMMDDYQLEDVIAAFVCVLNKRIPDRGG